MSWVYEHCQSLHGIRIHTYHLFPKRKGSLHLGQQFTTAKWACTCVGLADSLLMSGLGAPLAHFIQQSGFRWPRLAILMMELCWRSCIWTAQDLCVIQVTCPSVEISTFFLICPLIYMPLMSHFHGASFLSTAGRSVPCAWNVTHRITTPQPCLLHCSEMCSLPDLI